ncbi:hypothetical protein [Gulbenkiania mobilis]|uniref:hypothetical protein n=1 Tax=Gulbenkiania mobilis TaxID=397457 RepID=UPI00128F052C|nr:hypothetical protein [Gulbenkiania mobilis]
MSRVNESVLARRLLVMQRDASLAIANLEAEILTLHQDPEALGKARRKLVVAQMRYSEVTCAIHRVADGSFGYCKLTTKRIDAETLYRNPASRFSREALEILRKRGYVEESA